MFFLFNKIVIAVFFLQSFDEGIITLTEFHFLLVLLDTELGWISLIFNFGSTAISRQRECMFNIENSLSFGLRIFAGD